MKKVYISPDVEIDMFESESLRTEDVIISGDWNTDYFSFYSADSEY